MKTIIASRMTMASANKIVWKYEDNSIDHQQVAYQLLHSLPTRSCGMIAIVRLKTFSSASVHWMTVNNIKQNVFLITNLIILRKTFRDI